MEEGTAIWINEVGAIRFRVFRIIGRKEGEVKIDLGEGDILKVKEKFIRAKRVVIFKTSDGRILVQNPDKWKSIDLNKNNIKVLRFNLQNMGIQESRAAIHRWTLPADKLTKLSPLIKLLLICIVVGVIGWAAFKFGANVLDIVMNARLLDCSQVLPKANEVPIGAITNSTPIGV